ncbi:MAG TPA: formimidoylglutamate deiminase [Myxococcota bacterium]|nr:formimidoylglutamate deiminase [Myxococcota bacterium]
MNGRKSQSLALLPEFYVDFDGSPRFGSISIGSDGVLEFDQDGKDAPSVIRLKNQAVLPGFVNCHSHVFQRVLRGIAEPKSPGGDFWTWRDMMYASVKNMTKDVFQAIAELTYYEMLEAGFTHVGEFHYLHHDLTSFSEPLAMSRALFHAANKVGINLCLLECAYHQNSFSLPLAAEQSRFAFPTVSQFLGFLQNANDEFSNNDFVSVGCAIHSVRAVPEAWFLPINDFALAHNMPLHIHVSEQTQENEECLTATGCSPIGLLRRNHLLAPHATLVHVTHLINDDLELLSRSGRPHICICPSTEKNLGDGIVPLASLMKQKLPICIGSDQHVRLDPFCEARSLEELERLRLKRRGILNETGGYFYQPLLASLTKFGLSSLYPTDTHTSLRGQKANLVVVTLPPEYEWHGPEAALNTIMLTYHPAMITHVMVNGEFVIQSGSVITEEKQYLIKELKSFLKTLHYQN